MTAGFRKNMHKAPCVAKNIFLAVMLIPFSLYGENGFSDEHRIACTIREAMELPMPEDFAPADKGVVDFIDKYIGVEILPSQQGLMSKLGLVSNECYGFVTGKWRQRPGLYCKDVSDFENFPDGYSGLYELNVGLDAGYSVRLIFLLDDVYHYDDVLRAVYDMFDNDISLTPSRIIDYYFEQGSFKLGKEYYTLQVGVAGALYMAGRSLSKEYSGNKTLVQIVISNETNEVEQCLRVEREEQGLRKRGRLLRIQ